VAEALETLSKFRPQLVFLDIEMPHMNGFEFLERVHFINFGLIFTTSYDQYAIKAIRFSAMDYLLKPIDREELIQAVAKVSKSLQNPTELQLELLLQKFNWPKNPIKKSRFQPWKDCRWLKLIRSSVVPRAATTRISFETG
jgi:two-component system LytT family response regulator